MNKKIICLILFLIVFLNLPVFSAEKIKLHFWFSLPHDQAQLMDRLVEEFNKEHKHFLVITRNFKTPAELKKALFITQEPPAVAIINATWQKDLISRDKIVCVETLIERVGSMLKVVLKMDTFPSMWNSCVYNGKIQTMPYYAISRTLIYNPKKISKPPKTWEDLIKAGQKAAKGNQWAFGFSANDSFEELGKNFSILLLQLDSNTYDVYSKKVLLGNSESIKALELWQSLSNKHKISPKDFVDLDNLAMFIGTNEEFLKHKRNGYNFKAALLPRFNNSSSFLDLWSLAIFEQKNIDPSKSWYFVYWISEFPRALKWSLNTPYLPANKQVTLSPEYFEFLTQFPDIRIFLQGLAKAGIGPEIADSEEALRILGEKVKLAIDGRLSAAEALRQAADLIKKIDKEGPTPQGALPQ